MTKSATCQSSRRCRPTQLRWAVLALLVPIWASLSHVTASAQFYEQRTARIPDGAPMVKRDRADNAVHSLHELLLSTMRIEDFAARKAALQPNLVQIFNLVGMARVIMGPHWKTISTTQQTEFVDVFSKLNASLYAKNFASFDGEQFVILREESGPNNTIWVHTQIILSDGRPIALSYLTRAYREGWAVVDIFANGTLSQLAATRSEYQSILRKKGFAGLIGELRARIADHAQ